MTLSVLCRTCRTKADNPTTWPQNCETCARDCYNAHLTTHPGHDVELRINTDTFDAVVPDVARIAARRSW